MWLAFALLSTLSAIVRYFELSATVYTISYGVLVFVGLGTALYLMLQARRSGRIHGDLLLATLAPCFLLFVDLSSDWRVVCLLVIVLVAMFEWKKGRVGRDVA
jgi:hypothetical protein